MEKKLKERGLYALLTDRTLRDCLHTFTDPIICLNQNTNELRKW